MGNIDGMRAVLGLFLVSPVVPMHTVPMGRADVHGAAATALPAIVCHLVLYTSTTCTALTLCKAALTDSHAKWCHERSAVGSHNQLAPTVVSEAAFKERHLTSGILPLTDVDPLS